LSTSIDWTSDQPQPFGRYSVDQEVEAPLDVLEIKPDEADAEPDLGRNGGAGAGTGSSVMALPGR
jgi:hypothetical protein